MTVPLAGPLPAPDLTPKPVKVRDASRHPPDENSPLYVLSVNTWSRENGQHHRTKKFALAKLGTPVIRRGQPFKMTLTFNRPYNSLRDELKFFFETGEKPQPGNDTMICLSSYKTDGSSGWKADFLPETGVEPEPAGERADLWVYTPANCIVGDWKFSVQSIVRADDGTKTKQYVHHDRVYLLFNPWCQDDAVFFAEEGLLKEYILNPNGVIFQGSEREMCLKPWVYGQFEPGVLEACFHIIKQSFKFFKGPEMSDPITIVRNISTTLNADGDNGLVQGRWFTSNFRGGRPPTTWSGSVAILKQYVNRSIKTGEARPVRYVQCFVLSGLAVTICRAIGIPCRSVTNFNSGRDNDGTLIIDLNYELGKTGIDEVRPSNHDFVWKFHVWNDVWMARRDLKAPYNGPDWQALDATPQVSSAEGVHCCGPAPLKAVRDGVFDVPYDVAFLYSEVNADVLHWLRLAKGDWAVFKAPEFSVGDCISTKVPDGKAITSKKVFTKEELNNIRQDITYDYKLKEGCPPGRVDVKPVMRRIPSHQSSVEDVEFVFGEISGVNAGYPFSISATVRNRSSEKRQPSINIFCESVFYNGKRESVIKTVAFDDAVIPPGESETFSLEVTEQDYVGKLTEHTCMRAYVLARVRETNQVEAWVENFVIKKHNLVLEVEDKIVQGEYFEMKISFQNPLSQPLTNCSVSVEGAGLFNVEYVRSLENIPGTCQWSGVITLLPLRSGTQLVAATFYCAELLDLKGCLELLVAKKPKDEEKEGEGKEKEDT